VILAHQNQIIYNKINLMNNIPTRRERRAAMKYQGILKMKSKLPFKKWCEFTSNTIKAGKEIFEANRDRIEKSIGEQLEAIEAKLIVMWRDMGYTDSEIEQLREANAILTVRNMDTWHTDKKVARKIIKETQQALLSRSNG